MFRLPAIKFSPVGYVSQVWRDARATLERVARDRAALVTIVLMTLPWLTMWVIRGNLDWWVSFAEIAAVVFLGWWMSRSGALPAPTVKYPRAESLFAFVLIAVWMLWRVGICAKLLPFLPVDYSCFKSWQFEIAPKLFEQVVVPIVVLFALGYRWRAIGIHWSRRAWWILLPTWLGLLGYGAYTHWDKLPDYGQNIVEYFFAAGLPEEVLFRALLLTRLEAWWKNSAWALCGAAIIFGLVHLPINYLYFNSYNMREAWITLLTFQMGMGAAFAFAYQRTRNIWALAVVHTLIDVL